jgi:hypothetical protein
MKFNIFQIVILITVICAQKISISELLASASIIGLNIIRKNMSACICPKMSHISTTNYIFSDLEKHKL